MDCSRVGDQYFTESDRANTEIWDSRTSVGIGGKDEEAKGQPPPGPVMISCEMIREQSGSEDQVISRQLSGYQNIRFFN